MPRTVPEWIGKTDDAVAPESCQRRILARQNGVSVISGRPFTAKDKPQFDHVVPLWLGGSNRESNLQAIHADEHARKTSVEAGVRAKINRQQAKHLGIKKRSSRPMPGSKAAGLKKCMDGTVMRRDDQAKSILERSRA